MYSMSILANAGNLNDIFEICRNIFIVLLSKSLSHCREDKQYLHTKMSNIEPVKTESLIKSPCESLKVNAESNTDDDLDIDRPSKEETYLQQSKRSVYYKVM